MLSFLENNFNPFKDSICFCEGPCLLPYFEFSVVTYRSDWPCNSKMLRKAHDGHSQILPITMAARSTLSLKWFVELIEPLEKKLYNSKQHKWLLKATQSVLETKARLPRNFNMERWAPLLVGNSPLLPLISKLRCSTWANSTELVGRILALGMHH